MAFDGFWNDFLLLLKIKRPGRLFPQKRWTQSLVEAQENRKLTASSESMSEFVAARAEHASLQ